MQPRIEIGSPSWTSVRVTRHLPGELEGLEKLCKNLWWCWNDNAKALFKDMYHGIKTEFLQEYLNEFCYKFNRMHFNDRTFDRLMIASVSYTPTFKHRKYDSNANCG